MVKVRGLFKRFEGEKGVVKAVDGIEFEVPAGEMFTLLGPSGCGKSTTLRCLAGLETAERGEIEVDGQLVSSEKRGVFVPAHKRDIGMVFQSYAIWPHMSVFDNVAFPLKVGSKKPSRKELKRRVEKALSLVKLAGLEDRPAPLLSGGQQQRLALARALVREPKVLLLDEPLSNLDAKLREYMRFELKALQRQLGITTVYVTHDQLEALALSDTIAVMNDGKIVQMGSPKGIYEWPECRFVADFVGSSNLITGTVRETAPDLSTVDTAFGPLCCPIPDGLKDQDKVLISLRLENIDVHKSRPPMETNVWEGQVETAAFLGEFLDCQFLVGENVLRCRAHPSLDVKSGEKVYLHIHPQTCIVLGDEH